MAGHLLITMQLSNPFYFIIITFQPCNRCLLIKSPLSIIYMPFQPSFPCDSSSHPLASNRSKQLHVVSPFSSNLYIALSSHLSSCMQLCSSHRSCFFMQSCLARFLHQQLTSSSPFTRQLKSVLLINLATITTCCFITINQFKPVTRQLALNRFVFIELIISKPSMPQPLAPINSPIQLMPVMLFIQLISRPFHHLLCMQLAHYAPCQLSPSNHVFAIKLNAFHASYSFQILVNIENCFLVNTSFLFDSNSPPLLFLLYFLPKNIKKIRNIFTKLIIKQNVERKTLIIKHKMRRSNSPTLRLCQSLANTK